MTLPIYLVNLDRRPDRLEAMAKVLDGLGLPFRRFSAVDAKARPEGRLHPRVVTEGHVIPMGRGSQAYAASMLRCFEEILAGPGAEQDAVIMLQDDVMLSRDFARFCADDSWIPEEIGLVQLEKWQERKPLKLLGNPILQMPGAAVHRDLRRLYMRTGGAAAFWIRRRVIRQIVEGSFEVRFPADHLLFSPNVSPVYAQAGVAIVTPALATQTWDNPSDIKADRLSARTWRSDLRRSVTEVNRLPMQLALMATGRARMMDPGYAE